MTKKADNPEVDSAEIIIPSIPKEETSATENLAKEIERRGYSACQRFKS